MRVVFSFVVLLLVVSSISLAQQSDETTRKLWDTAFISSPTSKKPAAHRRATYRIATPSVPVDNVMPDTVVGVTLWRLRAANRADSGARLIVHDDNATTEWVPERISANTRLAQGDRLRIS